MQYDYVTPFFFSVRESKNSPQYNAFTSLMIDFIWQNYFLTVAPNKPVPMPF